MADELKPGKQERLQDGSENTDTLRAAVLSLGTDLGAG
jgi:hypothetical protein